MYEDQVITAILISLITALVYKIYIWLARLEKRLERIEVNQEWMVKRLSMMEKYIFRDYFNGHDPPPNNSDSDS
jgi:Ni/Fe-hydrogenase subunit HybB-like protein